MLNITAGDFAFIALAINPVGGLLVAIPFAIFTLHYHAWAAVIIGTPLGYVQAAAVDVAWVLLAKIPAWMRLVEGKRSPRVERAVASRGAFWITAALTPLGPWLVMAFMKYAHVRQRRVIAPIMFGILCTASVIAALCVYVPKAFARVAQ